jgi:two-component system copper resistance phosphate regulon response regulator CusR
MMPKPGSDAVNHGGNGGCPAVDERGVARPQHKICDIGAVEVKEHAAGPDDGRPPITEAAPFVVQTPVTPLPRVVRPGYSGTLREAMDPSARVTGVEPALAGRVLLVDDEQRIVNFVRRGLEAEGLEVDTAGGGEEGLRLARSRGYDLVILDLVMPDIDGLSVLQQILERKPSQPVLVLSALSDTASKVRSLELGAEDYLSKPFSLEELLARVRARLRTAARADQTKLAVGPTTLDLIRHQVDDGRGPVPLADREFLLLQELMRHAGRSVSKERLLSSVWGYHFDPGSNVVDVYVRRLRAKLGPDAITTIRGVGYRFDAS